MSIEAKNISVSLGGNRIVHSASLVARPGQMTAICGPNGSGKTTLLKAISGDLAYTGEVHMNGRDLTAMKPWEAASIRGVLPQATSLSFPFTVREIVALGLMSGRSGAPAGEERRLPERALAAVDLEGFSGRFYQEISGGEQQRVQLARVLCQMWAPVLSGEPRYLFLDEPVSSLDIKHQLIIMRIAHDFARRGGGVIAIMHDLNLTAMFADQVVLMHKGGIAAAGAPAEVLTDEVIERVFDCALRVGALPAGNIPFILPQSAA